MGVKRIGSLRSSQIITTYGPGALVDLPQYSVIVAGLDTWRPTPTPDQAIKEPRLAAKLQTMTGLPQPPLLYSPPPANDEFWFTGGSGPSHIGVRRFPEWFVVQSPPRKGSSGKDSGTSRRLVPLRQIRKNRFRRQPVVATRFVRACRRGHVDDLDWREYVQCAKGCIRPLWLDESGTSGDLSDLVVRCECGAKRRLGEAANIEENNLGFCTGKRPWLGKYAKEPCTEYSRLLIRTATNAYFPQVVRILSIPDTTKQIDREVNDRWITFQKIPSPEVLTTAAEFNPDIQNLRDRFGDAQLLDAAERRRKGGAEARTFKQLEVEAFLNAPEGYGDDIPINNDFHARALPDSVWRKTDISKPIAKVVQLHRLREVSALVGFTRFEGALADINGEYETDVTRAELDEHPTWFPAVENRGEGIFLALSPKAMRKWSRRPAVQERVGALEEGYERWRKDYRGRGPQFPGGAYVLLHTLSHLLMQTVANRCGYPATSIRERIYLVGDHYGILLYTASSDADGTLGGLVQQARHLEGYLVRALRAGCLCSSDPICAQHTPHESLDKRWLHGAACHSCSLIAETSCEMQNQYLDRALVVPTLATAGAALFPRPE